STPGAGSLVCSRGAGRSRRRAPRTRSMTRRPLSLHGLARSLALVLLVVTGGAGAQLRMAAAAADARGETDSLPRAVPPAAVASTAARVILDRVRPAMIQIKGFFGTNTAEAFHGSGFAVAARGVFLTNWHVVSEAVLYPEKYRLEYRTPTGATGRV